MGGGVKEVGDLVKVDIKKEERVVVRGPFDSYFLESYRGIIVKQKNVEGFCYRGKYYFNRPVVINNREYPYLHKQTKLWGYYIWGAPHIIKRERETLKRYRRLLDKLVPTPIMPDIVFTEIPPEFPHSGSYSFQDDMEIVMTVYVSWRKKEGAPALPHELAHHVYILLPPEMKEKAEALWQEMNKVNGMFKLLTEGIVLENAMPHWGHPWDGPEEMFASALHVFQRGKGLPKEVAEEVITKIIGEEIVKEVFK